MRAYLLLLCLTGLLTACGGSGGSGGSGSTTPPSGGTADFRLLIGDGPTDEFVSVMLDVESATLIGDNGQINLPVELDDPIDLLALRNLAEVLVDTEVPAGTYSKIRLNVRNIVLIRADATEETPPLPANGKIDLNPQGAFNLIAGGEVEIELDWDLDRSLQIVGTGNSGYRVRPVVLVKVTTPGSGRITLLSGVVTELVTEQGSESLVVCKPQDLDDCTDVSLADVEVLLDMNGDAIEIGALALDQQITAFGRFGADGVFNAVALATVPKDDLSRLEGTIAAPLEVDRFLFTEEDEGNTTIELAMGTVILDDDGVAAGTEALLPEIEAEIWGITRADESSTVALLIQLDDVDDEEEEDAEGTFVSYAAPELTLADELAETFCVTLSEATEILLITEEIIDNEERTVTDTLDLDEFAAAVAAEEITGPEVEFEAFGDPGERCLVAELLLVEND